MGGRKQGVGGRGRKQRIAGGRQETGNKRQETGTFNIAALTDVSKVLYTRRLDAGNMRQEAEDC